MKKYLQIIVLAVCVLVTVCITVFDVKSNEDKLEEKLKSYVETTAVVKAINPSNITRYGSKQPSYDLEVLLNNGTKVNMYKRQLGGDFKIGDTILILYNPESPHDDIYLKK